MKKSEFEKRQNLHMKRNIRNEEDIMLVNDNIISFPTSQLLIRHFQRKNDELFELENQLRILTNNLNKLKEERKVTMNEYAELQQKYDSLVKENTELKEKLAKYENTDLVKLVIESNNILKEMKSKQSRIECVVDNCEWRISSLRSYVENH